MKLHFSLIRCGPKHGRDDIQHPFLRMRNFRNTWENACYQLFGKARFLELATFWALQQV